MMRKLKIKSSDFESQFFIALHKIFSNRKFFLLHILLHSESMQNLVFGITHNVAVHLLIASQCCACMHARKSTPNMKIHELLTMLYLRSRTKMVIIYNFL